MKKSNWFLTAILALAVGISSMGCGGGDYAIPSVVPTLTLGTVATPTANPPGGTAVASGTPVTLSCATSGVTIYYTTNGSTPTTGSTPYSSPISITTGTTLKAIAVKSGMNNSTVLTAAYTVDPTLISDMVYIQPGDFSMGQEGIEGATVHTVTISKGFWMGKHEVTQAQFQEVMGINPSSDSGVGDKYPVYNVSWYGAIAYCNKLSIAKGLTPVYSVDGIGDWAELEYSSIPVKTNDKWNAASLVPDADGYRLPTEEEWEYACRAGTMTMFNNGKDTINHSEANFRPNSLRNPEDEEEDEYDENPDATPTGQTTTVGSYAPNAWGLYDMHGNVGEWCWDLYSTHPTHPDYVDPAWGYYRMSRGGGWLDYAAALRSAFRADISPNTGEPAQGFRVVRP